MKGNRPLKKRTIPQRHPSPVPEPAEAGEGRAQPAVRQGRGKYPPRPDKTLSTFPPIRRPPFPWRGVLSMSFTQKVREAGNSITSPQKIRPIPQRHPSPLGEGTGPACRKAGVRVVPTPAGQDPSGFSVNSPATAPRPVGTFPSREARASTRQVFCPFAGHVTSH
jgi:hypothetical protein